MNEDKYLAHINTSIDSLNILLNTPSHQISEFPGVKVPDGLCRISLISDGRWENATITFFTFDYLFPLRLPFLPWNQPMPKILQRWEIKVYISTLYVYLYNTRFHQPVTGRSKRLVPGHHEVATGDTLQELHGPCGLSSARHIPSGSPNGALESNGLVLSFPTKIAVKWCIHQKWRIK